MPITTASTRHEIREATTARQCQRCGVLTFWRLAYVYALHDVVTVPRCSAHLGTWARLHDVAIPEEAAN